jgi:hypothetical protein
MHQGSVYVRVETVKEAAAQRSIPSLQLSTEVIHQGCPLPRRRQLTNLSRPSSKSKKIRLCLSQIPVWVGSLPQASIANRRLVSELLRKRRLIWRVVSRPCAQFQLSLGCFSTLLAALLPLDLRWLVKLACI